MLSKNQISRITALHLKKNRGKGGFFLVEGTKMVKELLNSSYVIDSIYAIDEWLEKHLVLIGKKTAVNPVTDAELKKISALSTPQQVLAVAKMPDYKMEMKALKGNLTLLVDEVKDPGNLGTIIRIADWFGISTIICSENTVDVYNPKVVQATMGSLFRVKIFYSDIGILLKENKGNLRLPVYAAVMNGSSVYNASLSNEGFIILGNESEGVGEDLMNYIDQKLTIPSFADNKSRAESLNVATAAAIICSEFRRRSQ